MYRAFANGVALNDGCAPSFDILHVYVYENARIEKKATNFFSQKP